LNAAGDAPGSFRLLLNPRSPTLELALRLLLAGNISSDQRAQFLPAVTDALKVEGSAMGRGGRIMTSSCAQIKTSTGAAPFSCE
jgi:hypothetical protein